MALDQRTSLLLIILGVALCMTALSTAYFAMRWRQERRKNQNLRSRVLNNLISPAYLSHEIRTPLTVMKGASELLEEDSMGSLNETQRKFLHTITTNCATAIALAEDYLVLFSLEKTLADLRVEKTELRHAIRQAIQEFRLMHPSDVRLDNHGAPIYLDADLRLLKQALWNLVTNALRHGGPGTTVDVRVSAQDGIALLQVEDNGRGMQPESPSFPELTADADIELPKSGSGIGMNIVKCIAAAHRGRLIIDTTVGKGTRILIQIPEYGSDLDLSVDTGGQS